MQISFFQHKMKISTQTRNSHNIKMSLVKRRGFLIYKSEAAAPSVWQEVHSAVLSGKSWVSDLFHVDTDFSASQKSDSTWVVTLYMTLYWLKAIYFTRNWKTEDRSAEAAELRKQLLQFRRIHHPQFLPSFFSLVKNHWKRKHINWIWQS